MPKPNQDAVRKLVNPEHHNWVSTDSIKAKLVGAYPKLEFPWLETEHMHGVNSIVTGVCREHHQTIPMIVGNLWRETTKYGCHECAMEHGGEFDGHEEFNIRRNHPNYKGQSKVEFNLFCAIKEVFPDALAHHRMKGRKEIDIWIPSIRAGVEYNGNYWHNEKSKRGETYHFDKSNTGWREEKFILHLFTEEALNLKAVIESLKLFDAYRTATKSVRRKLQFGPISSGSAKQFHSDHNPVHDFNTPEWNWHLAVYDESFKTVAVLSGVKEISFITKATLVDKDIYIGDILEHICKAQKVQVVFMVDSRNPLEIMSALGSTKLIKTKSLPPLPLPMDNDYKIISIRSSAKLGSMEDMSQKFPGENVRAWDSGRLLFFVKGYKPHWLP